MGIASPPGDVHVTANCLACNLPLAAGRARRYCSHSCRQDAYRRRHQPALTPTALPARRSRLDGTVYTCNECETRYLVLRLGSSVTSWDHLMYVVDCGCGGCLAGSGCA